MILVAIGGQIIKIQFGRFFVLLAKRKKSWGVFVDGVQWVDLS